MRDDVIILGGGVIGLSCAYALSLRGRSVRILDRAGLGTGSSWGNCGLVTPSHAAPIAQPGLPWKALRSFFDPEAPLRVKPRLDPALMRWGLEFFRRCNATDAGRGLSAKAAILNVSRDVLGAWIERESMQCEWQEIGLLMVYKGEEAFATARGEEAELSAAGVPFKVLDGGEVAKLEPALKEGMAGGRLFEMDAHLRPDRLVRELERVVRQRGVAIDEGWEVTGVEADAGGAIKVMGPRGTLAARNVVVALGAWSPSLARSLDLWVPVQPGKGYTVTTAAPPIPPRIPLLFEERKVAITPWQSGFRVGSTMEFTGFDTSLNRRRLDALWRAANEYLKEPEAAGPREEWCGFRPMTPDDLPLLGWVPSLPGAYLATGHNMLGVSMAAGTGEAVAAALCGEEPPLDLRPYDPRRFH